jgi:ribosomal protein S18 acetylase RimI-like enzyme
MDEVSVRPFKEEDFLRVSQILAQSFQDKFERLSHVEPERMPALLMESGILYDRPFPGYFVAERSGTIIGTVMLKWVDQKRPPNAKCPKRRTRWMERQRLRFGLSLLGRRPEVGVCYVEYLGVAPECRRMGVGSALLNEARAFATACRFKKLRLFVASDNVEAVDLYLKMGFRRVKKVESGVTQRFFGIREWWSMELELPP